MIEAVLVVMSKPRPGRDADFNDWYTNIHIRDALRFRGSIAAQRFALAAAQPHDLPASYDWRYLALYDVFDAARFSREHWENMLTSRGKVTDAFDDTVLDDYHYYPLQFRDNDPETPHRGGVILEQINPAPGREDAFRRWYDADYLPAAMARPGVKSGGFLVFRDYGQLMPTRPKHRYVAIYRIDGAEAAMTWRDAGALLEAAPVERASLLVTQWDRLTDRVSEDQVLNTSAAALAAEERARARMGERVVTDGLDKLAADPLRVRL